MSDRIGLGDRGGVAGDAWMIGSTRAIRVFAYASMTDMRKSYNGLEGFVLNELKHDILKGDLYLFVNRRRNLKTKDTAPHMRLLI